MKINSKHSVEQYSNFNLKDFFGMNSPKKLLIPAVLVGFLCIAGLAFFSFVNPSYDQEAALKMKPIFFGSTRVADDPDCTNNDSSLFQHLTTEDAVSV